MGVVQLGILDSLLNDSRVMRWLAGDFGPRAKNVDSAPPKPFERPFLSGAQRELLKRRADAFAALATKPGFAAWFEGLAERVDDGNYANRQTAAQPPQVGDKLVLEMDVLAVIKENPRYEHLRGVLGWERREPLGGHDWLTGPNR